jgi:hypothetical protein
MLMARRLPVQKTSPDYYVNQVTNANHCGACAPSRKPVPSRGSGRLRETNMERRRLGGSGLWVSEVGVGCNNFGGRMDAAGTRAVVDAALDQGIDFFDTADVYGAQQSEVLLGQALGSRRQQVVIATKFGMATGPTVHDKGGRDATFTAPWKRA